MYSYIYIHLHLLYPMLGGNGGGSPMSSLASIFSCLSPQGQALLRGSYLKYTWFFIYMLVYCIPMKPLACILSCLITQGQALLIGTTIILYYYPRLYYPYDTVPKYCSTYTRSYPNIIQFTNCPLIILLTYYTSHLE
jgi:hypothetical protein